MPVNRGGENRGPEKPGRFAVPRYLLAGSVALFVVSYFAARFTDFPGAWAGSYISTALIALPSAVALWRYMGAGRASLSLGVLAVFGFAIESTGTVTGFPYGAFFYGDSLGPKIAGHVPYILPVSYVPLVIGAVAACVPARSLTSPAGPARGLAWVVVSALLLTLVDGVLDPGAAALGFWVWPEGGAYYGVPLTNYAGWVLSGLLACALLVLAGRWREPPPGGLLDSVLLALAFWCGVAVFEGLWLPALLGAGLYAALFVRRRGLTKG
ncbi:carotenoid biosynthesis protein [Rubrobacter aplysinae]|uniref:carotenoid biosynthesis protein n=1 Tax=Rubrobacter aplysinae TaxID=909625 RepID=UPI00069F9F54|nr:carotenoid biosynthesis protein [Rubrobacter aplysinae]